MEAAKVAIDQVYDKELSGEEITPAELEQMASNIHDAWLKRNTWVFDANYGNPKLAVPYAMLSLEEQNKDKAQIRPAQAKVNAYLNGLINIDEICAKYNISTTTRKL